MKKVKKGIWFLLGIYGLIHACTSNSGIKNLEFEQHIITNDANNWWAKTLADLDGNDTLEIIIQDNNAFGGWLGYFSLDKNGNFNLTIIADSASVGRKFACGDLAAADIDNDGDVDILGVLHEGEWKAGKDPSELFWFENPGWEPHFIGNAPAFIKDLELADFNMDGKMDVVAITFESNSLQIFIQQPNGWKTALDTIIPNLHEGMAVGDINGDGFNDIATNGFWLASPGNDTSKQWSIKNIDEQWHKQEGDWSRNATKNFIADIDNDGKAEVFISHSERKAYPLAWYSLINPENNTWEMHVVDTIDACHTIQVFDFNLDGLPDVLAGENQQRWWKNDSVDPLNIYLNTGKNRFTRQTLSPLGIYNGLAGDIDADGDVDFIRTAGHSSTKLEIWLNKTTK